MNNNKKKNGGSKPSINNIGEESMVLSERDFYPPSDNRVLQSYIEDVDGGDTFADYTKYIFDIYENEDWYEN